VSRVRLHLALLADAVGGRRVAQMLGLQVVVALMEGAGLILLAPVLQSISGDDRLAVPGLGTHLSLAGAIGLVVVVAVARGVAAWRVAIVSVDIRLGAVDALRQRLVDDLFTADWSFVAGQRRSHLVQSLTTEVERTHAALLALTRMIVTAMILAATVVVAVLISPVIGGLAAAALLAVPFVSRRALRDASVRGSEVSVRARDLGAALTDSLSAVRLIRAHDAAASWSRLVAEESRRMRDVRRDHVRSAGGVVAALSVVAVVAVLALVLVGRAADLSVPELVALAVVASRVLASAQTVLTSAQAFAHDAPALVRLDAFGAEIRTRQEHVGTVQTPSAADPSAPLVALRDVTVRHSDDLGAVLEHVTLEIPRRGLVVLSGASGAGKSTLLDVLIGLLRPVAGEVLVDGAPLTDLAGWRARLGYVPQQTLLVPGSIRANLTWSLRRDVRATDEDLWAALRTASLDTVVRGLPRGLDAPLSELAELSGGEQQRLSIAAAVARRPDLVLLDEATSGLDTDTEMRVLDNLLDGTRAVVLVSHRTTAQSRADVVARIEDGSLLVTR
jgi:ATP-binding cassette subfamily C protein